MAKNFLDKTGLTQVWQIITEKLNGKVSAVIAGTNVVITGTSMNPIISVPGIELPEKFTSTDSPSGAVGTAINSLSVTNATPIISGSAFNIGDIIIFANGYEGEVIAYNSGSQTYDAVIVSVPMSTSWGTIGGTLSNQTDLKTALDGKQKTLTPGSNITIDASGNISSANTATAVTSSSLTVTGSGFNLNIEAESISVEDINIICV
jgi:hypothetical protein